MPRLLIVDDHPAVRAGLAALVRPEPGWELCACAANAEEALAAARAQAPDIVLADFHLPGEDGLALCLRLTSGAAPRPRVVLYSAWADDGLAVLAAVAGAAALVPKSADPGELLAVLAQVGEGGAPPRAVSPAALAAVGAALEPGDLPVLGMLLHDVPPDEVAATLQTSPEWLRARRWAILRALTPSRPRPAAVSA